MLPPRFYCPTLLAAGSVSLSEDEAHHLSRVMRIEEGESVELFNGQGLVGAGVVRRIQKRAVECDVAHVRQEVQAVPELVIATAVPKGERFDWLVEKTVELGVDRLIPLVTARSVVDPREGKLDRLRQTIIAASKQCRRARLMKLSPLLELGQLFSESTEKCLLIADPGGKSLATVPSGLPLSKGIVFMVGPEGGLTDEEISLSVAQGGTPVSLGPHILRIETAAIAAAAWGGMQRDAGG